MFEAHISSFEQVTHLSYLRQLKFFGSRSKKNMPVTMGMWDSTEENITQNMKFWKREELLVESVNVYS